MNRSVPIALVLVVLASCCLASCSSSSRPGVCASDTAVTSPPVPLTSAQRRTRSQWITRTGSQLRLAGHRWRFAGVNMYWLGLDDNVLHDGAPSYPTHAAVANGFCSAAELGANVVRSISLGVSVGSARSYEPRPGVFHPRALRPIDYAVALAHRFGIRLMIPLTDQQNYYSGGEQTFVDWYDKSTSNGPPPQSDFYTDPTVVSAYDDYIEHLLDHVNPLTRLRLGDDPTVAIWETGNEIYQAPPSWTEQTAAYIKSKAPHALVADGSDASGKDITQTGVDQPDVDIVDAHFYPTDTAAMRSAASYVAGRQKAYVVGEYPMTGADPRAWLATLARDSDVTGDLAWSLLPYDGDGRPEQHQDGYTFHFPGSSAKERHIDSLLRAHARAMDGR